MIFRRGKSRRVRLAAAIRRECDPLMFSFGFRHPNHWTWDRWCTTRRNAYLRWRGGDYDEVWLQWDRYGGAAFRINFFISRLTPPHPHGALARRTGDAFIHAWERGRVWPLAKDKFGPWRSIDATVKVAKQCLGEVNDFMLHERVGIHMWRAPRWTRVAPGEYGYSRLEHHGNPMLDIERDGDFVHPEDART